MYVGKIIACHVCHVFSETFPDFQNLDIFQMSRFQISKKFHVKTWQTWHVFYSLRGKYIFSKITTYNKKNTYKKKDLGVFLCYPNIG